MSLILVLVTAACTAPGGPPPQASASDVARLAQTFADLSPNVDAAEAALMAEIAYEYPRQLAVEYQVTDPPLIHNTKVNLGLRPRGLCYQWADDIEARLRRESFKTLEFHRAIANADNLLLDHSVLIVSHLGGAMEEGVVLDGWRQGGRLFWVPTLDDPRYIWVPRASVFEERNRQLGAGG